MKRYLRSLIETAGQMAIGLRLAIGFGLVMTLLVMSMAVSLLAMGNMQQRGNTILQVQYTKVTAATEIKYNVSQIHQLLRSAIIAAEYQGENEVKGQIVPLRKRNADVLTSFAQGLADARDRTRLEVIALLVLFPLVGAWRQFRKAVHQ